MNARGLRVANCGLALVNVRWPATWPVVVVQDGAGCLDAHVAEPPHGVLVVVDRDNVVPLDVDPLGPRHDAEDAVRVIEIQEQLFVLLGDEH